MTSKFNRESLTAIPHAFTAEYFATNGKGADPESVKSFLRELFLGEPMDFEPWNDEKHLLREATLADGSHAVLLEEGEGEFEVRLFNRRTHQIEVVHKAHVYPQETRFNFFNPDQVSKAIEYYIEHSAIPSKMSTLAHYLTAPEGTIVAIPGYAPYIKREEGLWYYGGDRKDGYTDEEMAASAPREVLRWGKGGEEA